MTRRTDKKAQAGRPSVFAAPLHGKTYPMMFTTEGARALAAIVKRTGWSRNAVLGVLVLRCADRLSLSTYGSPVFPGKEPSRMSIRLPLDAAVKFDAAVARSGRSYSDLGEALVRWYGAEAKTVPRGSAA